MAEAAAEFFGERAADYDGFICRLVPHYHEINALMVVDARKLPASVSNEQS